MRPNRIIVLAALVALAAKLFCAATTVGTNDTVFFYGFGKMINQHGLAWTYEHVSIFNHTPLVGAYAALLQRTEPGTQMRMELLPFFLRLPGIIADFLSVFVLMRLRTKIGGPPWWAIGLFALSPVAFMVSGFHGNVDSLLAFFLLTAAWLAAEDKPALCGIALGLACNVKVAPLLLGPVFLLWWWCRADRRAWRVFALCAALVTLAGWSPALVGAPRAFLGNVLGYQGYWGIWGVSWSLKQTGAEAFQKVGFEQLTAAQLAVMGVCKWLIIAATCAVAWWRRMADARGLFVSLAWVWVLFFVCAAGIAPQYFVWLAPFLLVAAPRWAAAVTAAASVFIFVFYNVTSNVITDGTRILRGDPWASPWLHPWNLAKSDNPHIALWGPWQLLPWLALIACLAWLSREAWKMSLRGVAESSSLDVGS
jgi:Gpi18-like mannosyltransferase